jgi:hypothetical protein
MLSHGHSFLALNFVVYNVSKFNSVPKCICFLYQNNISKLSKSLKNNRAHLHDLRVYVNFRKK